MRPTPRTTTTTTTTTTPTTTTTTSWPGKKRFSWLFHGLGILRDQLLVCGSFFLIVEEK